MTWYSDDDDDTAGEILYFLQGFYAPGSVFCYIMSPLCDSTSAIEFFWSREIVKPTTTLIMMTTEQVILPPFDIPTHAQSWVNTIVNLTMATYIPSLGVPLYLNMKDEFEDRMFSLLCCKPEYLMVTQHVHDSIVRIFFALDEWFISVDDTMDSVKNTCHTKTNMFLQLFSKITGTTLDKTLPLFDKRCVVFIFVVSDRLFYVGSCPHGSCVQPTNTPITLPTNEAQHKFPNGLLPPLPLLDVCNLKIHTPCKVGILNTRSMKLIYVSLTPQLPTNVAQNTLVAALCLHAHQKTRPFDTPHMLKWRQHCARWGKQIDKNRFQRYKAVIQSYYGNRRNSPFQLEQAYDTQRILSCIRILNVTTNFIA